MKIIKKNYVYLILIAFGTFVLFPSLAYVINQLLDKKIPLGEIKEIVTIKYFLDLLINPEVYKNFFSIQQINPINIGFLGISVFGLFAIVISSIGPNEKDKFEQEEKYGSHGTSRFQTKSEIKKNYYEGSRQGWFLGSVNSNEYEFGMSAAVHAIDNITKLNAQINVVGPPGSNKTTGLLYPNMFHIVESYKNSEEQPDIIVTDPKGEILAFTGNYFKENNYDIKIIDFLHLTYGDTTNPLSYIDEEKDIMKVANGFVGAAGMKNAKSQNADPIWDQGEGLLLGALIAFVLEVYPPDEQTFETVASVLASPNIRDFDKAETLFKRHNVTGYGEELWNKFLNLEDKLRSGVVGGLSIKMALFSLTKVKAITNRNSFDFNQIGRKKEKPLAIFIQMPDEDRTFSPIINTIISMMLKTMYSTARETQSRLPNPVYMILEEIANIGRLPSIEELLGTMRGRRIYPMMIWQDLVQMKVMFGDGWDGIVAKCDTQIYLGANDQFTAKYISEKLGKTTIKTQGISSKEGGLMSSGKSQSENRAQRQLLFPDEVERFNNEKLILVQRARHPVILNKTQYRYWENPITEPLELNDLPLISRFYTSNKKTNENGKSEFDIKSSENNLSSSINKEIKSHEIQGIENQEEIENIIDIDSGEIKPIEPEIYIEEPIIEILENEIEEEFEFDFKEEEIINLPDSVFEGGK